MGKSISLIIVIILASSLFSCKVDPLIYCNFSLKTEPIPQLNNICFGSCSSQDKDQPILNTICQRNPQLFIYLGDNIYGDSEDMKVLQTKYGKLSCKSEFQNLQKSCKVLATWDDHDFGKNDGGADYPKKEESKTIFLDFWKEPKNSDRFLHKGIYHSEYYGDTSHRVQIILLDLRTFRTPLMTDGNGNYIANNDPQSTMLGTEQWAWLQVELKKPAKLRIVCSSTQFLRSWDGYEAWENFPLEQQRFFDLIKDTHAEGVVFISGDVHLAELSKRSLAGMYPLYDMTSSGITQLEGGDISNSYREENVFLSYNFGQIKIDWTKADAEITLLACDINGKEQIRKTIPLSELKF